MGLQYHLPVESHYSGVFRYLTPKNILVGMIKPFIFAILISTVACWRGFRSEGGEGGRLHHRVGRHLVVGILVTDGICTRLIFRPGMVSPDRRPCH